MAGAAAAICDECVTALHHGCAPLSAAELSDTEALAILPAIESHAIRQLEHAADVVRELRRRRVTWREIAERLGTTRQAAWERFSSTARS